MTLGQERGVIGSVTLATGSLLEVARALHNARNGKEGGG